MQLKPVMVECTEVYLDERAFFEHAGSRDYLKAYGDVMAPGLMNRTTTVRLGRPTEYIVEKILGPMLKERVEPLVGDCTVWRPMRDAVLGKNVMILSSNAVGLVDDVALKVPRGLVELSTSHVVFAHPLRDGRVRVMCVLSDLPDAGTFDGLAALPLEGLEVHCEDTHREHVLELLGSVLPNVACHVSPLQAGYVLHEKAGQLEEE